MANTLAHLAVAHEILSLRPELVRFEDSFYLGTIAPDSIESKQGVVRDDKKLVHLRLGISDMEWLEPDKMAIFDQRLDDFIKQYLCGETDVQQRDFILGYIVHLITDKLHHGVVRLSILRRLQPEGYEDGTWPFIYRVLNELEAMDDHLLRTKPEIEELFDRLMSMPVQHELPGLIEKEYIEKSQRWWREEYIPQISRREANICAMDEIDEFIEMAADKIVPMLDNII